MSAKPAATRAAKNQTPAPRLKIVVRRLPPNLPEAVFWASTAPWIVRESDVDAEVPEGAERVAWSCFRAGKVRRSGKDKDDVHSRAYVAFKTVEALVAFHRGYDGWSFRDKQGNTSQAVVEFAPHQKIPVAPVKEDPRQGTIEEDADYAAFLVSLTAPEPEEKVEEPFKKGPQSTPLLDHLRAQKAAQLAARGMHHQPAPSTSKAAAAPSAKKGSRASKRALLAGAAAKVPNGNANGGGNVNPNAGGKGKGKGKAKGAGGGQGGGTGLNAATRQANRAETARIKAQTAGLNAPLAFPALPSGKNTPALPSASTPTALSSSVPTAPLSTSQSNPPSRNPQQTPLPQRQQQQQQQAQQAQLRFAMQQQELRQSQSQGPPARPPQGPRAIPPVRQQPATPQMTLLARPTPKVQQGGAQQTRGPPVASQAGSIPFVNPSGPLPPNPPAQQSQRGGRAQGAPGGPSRRGRRGGGGLGGEGNGGEANGEIQREGGAQRGRGRGRGRGNSTPAPPLAS